MSDEQYCLNVLLRVNGYSCDECEKYGTNQCKQICKNVEKMI